MKLTDADNAADGIFFPALEQNMMGAVLINENDEVMFFNPAAEKLWGYKREEVIGNNIDMLIPRDLRPAHPEYIRHNREGGKARVEGMSRELQLEKKDGSKIWTRFALSISKRVVCYTRMRLPRWRKVSVSPSYQAYNW